MATSETVTNLVQAIIDCVDGEGTSAFSTMAAVNFPFDLYGYATDGCTPNDPPADIQTLKQTTCTPAGVDFEWDGTQWTEIEKIDESTCTEINFAPNIRAGLSDILGVAEDQLIGNGLTGTQLATLPAGVYTVFDTNFTITNPNPCKACTVDIDTRLGNNILIAQAQNHIKINILGTNGINSPFIPLDLTGLPPKVSPAGVYYKSDGGQSSASCYDLEAGDSMDHRLRLRFEIVEPFILTGDQALDDAAALIFDVYKFTAVCNSK